MSADKQDKKKYVLCQFCRQKIHIKEFAGADNNRLFHKGCLILQTKWLRKLEELKKKALKVYYGLTVKDLKEEIMVKLEDINNVIGGLIKK